MGPRLKKRFGQHHLTRPELCEPLLRYLEPAGRRVIEVGPGGGILTRALIDAGARVAVVEIDPDWALSPGLLALRGRRVDVLVADAGRLAWARTPAGTLVTGNLPFQIATALIELLLPLHERVPRAAFLVQREVGERLTASPGSPAYGAFSVLARAAADVRVLGRVGRGSFNPPPRVDGVFVGLGLRPLPVPAEEWPAFCATVRLAFGLRRKTLRNALAVVWGRAEAERAVEALGGDARTRAESLELADFLRLHDACPRSS
jgi:16S rRNA (adenine1518-N6/adenine1519-N6)-dimethyltransferase